MRALHYIAGQNGYPFQLLRSVIEVNNAQRWKFYQKIKERLLDVENKLIGVWGLAFKPNTDDIRESIALDIIERLLQDGARIKVFDPRAMANTKERFKDQIEFSNSAAGAASNVDCLLVLTEWNDFKTFDLNQLKSLMRNLMIIDGRNIYDIGKMKELGFDYVSVGR